MKENIKNIEKLCWDGETENWEEPKVTIHFKDGVVLSGEITEEDVFQPDNGEEFWMIEELLQHAEFFEVMTMK